MGTVRCSAGGDCVGLLTRCPSAVSYVRCLHVVGFAVMAGVTDLLLLAKMTPGGAAATDGLSSPLVPAVFGLLEPGSLMGRLVVGHGDA